VRTFTAGLTCRTDPDADPAPTRFNCVRSLGCSVDIARSALQMSKKIVAMVNPSVPRTFGDGQIHDSVSA
jgi:hypothetical protein